MAKLNVRVSFVIPVEVPDDPDYDAEFDLVENHCCATGNVGAAIDQHIKRFDKMGFCWGCALSNEVEIVD